MRKNVLLWFGLFVAAVQFVVTPQSAMGLQKVDSQGNVLPDEAPEWAIVYDPVSRLYWEVKSQDDSIHSNAATYKFSKINKQFVSKLNEEKFGGFSDWRMPTSEELNTLRKKGSEPYIDLSYFPNTISSKYQSLTWCGSESEYQSDNVKFGKQRSKGGKYVRAVRGVPLEEL